MGEASIDYFSNTRSPGSCRLIVSVVVSSGARHTRAIARGSRKSQHSYIFSHLQALDGDPAKLRQPVLAGQFAAGDASSG